MEKKRDSFFLNNNSKKDYKKKEVKHESKDTFQKNRWSNFNKNRVGVETDSSKDGDNNNEKTEKKPFDKKTYRLKKYSKKYKLEQWEEQRKKKLMHEYKKVVKKESVTGHYKPISFDEDTPDSKEVGRFVRHPDLIEKENISSEENKKNKDPFKNAKDQFNKIKQEKMAKQEEIQKAREARQKKIEEYKRKKQERFKKLSKKTKKGQPVMTGRLELLLEKLQKEKASK